LIKIAHVDDSNFQRKMSKRNFDLAFPDAKYQALSDGDMVDLMNEKSNFGDVDIFFTDLLMDEVTGHDVIKYIKNINDKCCVVVLSSNIQKTEKEICFGLGADFFIEKPLSLEKLMEFKVYYNGRK